MIAVPGGHLLNVDDLILVQFAEVTDLFVDAVAQFPFHLEQFLQRLVVRHHLTLSIQPTVMGEYNQGCSRAGTRGEAD